MDIESINKHIQIENDNCNRNKNRLKQKLLDLKQRHQHTMENLKRQKEQVANPKNSKILKASENILNLLKKS